MADAQPIDPARFALALETLPIDALHSKAAELLNSVAHLHSSNQQMLPFAEEGDQDCKDAMFENLGVIGRMHERVQLIKREVERRGLRWSEAEVEDSEESKPNGTDMRNGDGELVNGTVGSAAGVVETNTTRAQSGRLTDDELRRRLEEQMREEEEEGVHL